MKAKNQQKDVVQALTVLVGTVTLPMIVYVVALGVVQVQKMMQPVPVLQDMQWTQHIASIC